MQDAVITPELGSWRETDLWGFSYGFLNSDSENEMEDNEGKHIKWTSGHTETQEVEVSPMLPSSQWENAAC